MSCRQKDDPTEPRALSAGREAACPAGLKPLLAELIAAELSPTAAGLLADVKLDPARYASVRHPKNPKSTCQPGCFV